jgi:hypothetical protein
MLYMARRTLRGVEYVCDRCNATARAARNLPPGWVRLLMTFMAEGAAGEQSLKWDLCPDCVSRVDDALQHS